jgi:hypothetical protein
MYLLGTGFSTHSVQQMQPANKDVNTEVEGMYGVGSRYQTTTGDDTAD